MNTPNWGPLPEQTSSWNCFDDNRKEVSEMEDHEFEILKIQAAVAPQKESWPTGDVQVSIAGPQPTIKGDLYWSSLHDCVRDARERVTTAFAAMALVDEDESLSPAGKASKRQEIATDAIAGFEKAKSLTAARSSVEQQVAKWDKKLGLTPKAPEGVSDAMILAEIRSHLAAMKPAERLGFIDSHAGEVAAAVLSAPSFLSGLTPAELAVVRQSIEARADPEIAAAKQAAIKALSETESGVRAAIRQISERGNVVRAGVV